MFKHSNLQILKHSLMSDSACSTCKHCFGGKFPGKGPSFSTPHVPSVFMVLPGVACRSVYLRVCLEKGECRVSFGA